MTDLPPKPGPKQILGKLLPPALLRERSTFLRLGPIAGPIYARMRLLDWIGMRSSNVTGVVPGARSFLFVCFGNLMRSPMAEAMFRKAVAAAQLNEIRAASAGLHAVPGTEAHPWALTAAQELNLPLTAHRAQSVTREMVADADVIFAMDFQNKAELLAEYPESKGKAVMLSSYANGPQRGREIADPYFGDLPATRECYSILQSCIENLVEALVQKERQHSTLEADVSR